MLYILNINDAARLLANTDHNLIRSVIGDLKWAELLSAFNEIHCNGKEPIWMCELTKAQAQELNVGGRYYG